MNILSWIVEQAQVFTAWNEGVKPTVIIGKITYSRMVSFGVINCEGNIDDCKNDYELNICGYKLKIGDFNFGILFN